MDTFGQFAAVTIKLLDGICTVSQAQSVRPLPAPSSSRE